MKQFKIPLLYMLSFVLSIGPVLIYFFANADRYFVTLSDKVKLTSGLVFLIVIMLLKVLGRLKMPSRAVFFGLVLVMCYLFERVLNDLIVFSFLALVGEMLDMVCGIYIRRAKEERISEKAADKTAERLERMFNGRV